MADWMKALPKILRHEGVTLDVFDDPNGAHPRVLAQNEGMIENRVLNVTSYGIVWYIDFSWAAVTAF